MTVPPSARAAALEARFGDIAATRMRGVPVLHEGLAVQAVGFEAVDDGLVGVLVTPWFMNLVWPAQQVLAILRAPPPAPSRRALLFGRPAQAAR